MRLARVLVPVLALAGSTASAAPPSLRLFDSPGDAVRALLAKGPQRVLALGEFHEVEGGPKVRSSLVHFRDEILPVLAPLASDLVLETWVTDGQCGATEQKVAAQVEETTQRPESTESEIVTLAKRAKAAGVTPHILTMSCRQYRAILGKGGKGDGGEIDYVALLETITKLLEGQIDAALARRPADPSRRAVLVYGGAAHIDLAPRPELRRFSYAPSVARKTRGRLLSLALYVPEFIERSDDIKAQPWYGLLAGVPPGKTALVQRGPSSYVLVFARGG